MDILLHFKWTAEWQTCFGKLCENTNILIASCSCCYSLSSLHPVPIVTFQVVEVHLFPYEIPCHSSEEKQVFGSFSLLKYLWTCSWIFFFLLSRVIPHLGFGDEKCKWWHALHILNRRLVLGHLVLPLLGQSSYCILFALLICKTLLQRWSWCALYIP